MTLDLVKLIFEYNDQKHYSLLRRFFRLLDSFYYAASAKRFDCVVAGSNIFLGILAVWYSSFHHEKTLFWITDKSKFDDWNYNLLNISSFRKIIEEVLNLKSFDYSGRADIGTEEWIGKIISYIISDIERNYMERGWCLFLLNNNNEISFVPKQTYKKNCFVIKNKKDKKGNRLIFFDENNNSLENKIRRIFGNNLLRGKFVVRMKKLKKNSFLIGERLIITSQIEGFLSFFVNNNGEFDIDMEKIYVSNKDIFRKKILLLGNSRHVYNKIQDAIWYPIEDINVLSRYFNALP